jgi:hypothetical protein
MSEWIKCSERLPHIERVLVRTTVIGCAVASRGGPVDSDFNFLPGWKWGVVNDVEIPPAAVTHWMPLPARPVD